MIGLGKSRQKRLGMETLIRHLVLRNTWANPSPPAPLPFGMGEGGSDSGPFREREDPFAALCEDTMAGKFPTLTPSPIRNGTGWLRQRPIQGEGGSVRGLCE